MKKDAFNRLFSPKLAAIVLGLIAAALAALLADVPQPVGPQPSFAQGVTPTVTPAPAATPTATPGPGICGRTQEIIDAINGTLRRKYQCGDVTGDVLAGITSLEVLYSSGLAAGDFDGLTNVQNLLLWSSPITSLPEGVLDDLAALRDLNLSNNKINSLPENIFDNNIKLTKLRLDFNKLTALPKGVFDENPDLTSLNLKGNSLASLPAGLFDNNPKLYDVHLGENKIAALPADLLDSNTALEGFYINNNELVSLPGDLFDTNTALRKVRLDHNKLTKVPQEIFQNNTGLRYLRLDNNHLTSVPAGLYKNNGLLWYFILSDNKLTSLPADLIPDQTEQDGSFAVALHNNQLSVLPDDLFEVPSLPLVQLLLEGNPGAPFPFTMEAELVSEAFDEENIGTARVRYKVVGGAPVFMESDLSVAGGTASASSVVVNAGEIYSSEITVTQSASGAPATLTLDGDLRLSVPPRGAWDQGFIPHYFSGVTFGTGPSLSLFESASSSQATDVGGI